MSTSYTSLYNPQGNGQCKRYNAIIWTAVKLSLKTRNLPIEQWQVVLPDTLHSIRSLLCTAINTTPHERIFTFSRRSCLGLSTPTWLSLPGNILLKRHVRTSKQEPLVDEVKLMLYMPPQIMLEFDYPTVMKKLSHCAISHQCPKTVLCKGQLPKRTSDKQRNRNSRPTSKKLTIYAFP